MAEEIVQSFNRLSRAERGAALEGLVASLSDYEWRDLLQLLSTRRFKVDIIGSSKMPLELLIWIFDYLPRTNAFTLQSVCKAWHHKLNCAETLNALLDYQHYRLNTPLSCDLNQSSPDKLDVLRKKAELVLRQQNLRPKIIFEISVSDCESAKEMQLGGHQLVWLGRDKRSFHVFNLQDGKYKGIVLPGRQEGKLAALTAEYVIIDSQNYRYAFGVTGRASLPAQLKLPFRNHHELTSYDQHLAVSVHSKLLEKHGERLEVHVWNMRTNRSHSFKIASLCRETREYKEDTSSINGLAGVWLHTTSGLITFVYLCPDGHGVRLTARFRQTNLDGIEVYDEHFHFEYREFADSGYERVGNTDLCSFNRCTGSSIIHLSLGRLMDCQDEMTRNLVLQLDISSTPPLQPGKTEIWLCGHPTYHATPFRLLYKGIIPKYVVHVEDGSDENIQDEMRLPESILYHRYALDENVELDDDVAGYGYERLSKMIEQRKHLPTASAGVHRWEYHGWFSYHAISLPPDCEYNAKFDLFALSQVGESWASRSGAFLHMEVQKNGSNTRTQESFPRVQLDAMRVNDNFIVVGLPDHGTGTYGRAVRDTIFVVFAFDPDYVVPQNDLTTGLRILERLGQRATK